MKLKKKTKEEIISAVNTFVSAFMLTIVPSITDIDWNNIEQSAIISIAAVALRAAVKALVFKLFPQE